MSKIVGRIDSKGSKVINTRNGPATVYSMRVSGEWYGCGFNEPVGKEGDVVEFDVVMNGQYTNAENITLADAATPTDTAETASPQPEFVNKRDVSIQFQSSRKDAIQIVGIMLANDALPIKATKPEDKYDIILATTKELTNQLYSDVVSVTASGGVV